MENIKQRINSLKKIFEMRRDRCFKLAESLTHEQMVKCPLYNKALREAHSVQMGICRLEKFRKTGEANQISLVA